MAMAKWHIRDVYTPIIDLAIGNGGSQEDKQYI